CTPLPSETSSPFAVATLQWRSRSAFHSFRFASRSSGVNFASTYGLNTPPPGRPRQPVRSLPLKSAVKPDGAEGFEAWASTAAEAQTAARTTNDPIADARRGMLENLLFGRMEPALDEPRGTTASRCA